MSRLILNEVTAPSAPASGKVAVYSGLDEKIKVLDDQGFTSVLTPDGWRDKNILLIGDFNYYQRGAHTATLNTNRTYGPDRWGMSIQVSSNTFTQVDTSGATEAGYQPQYYGRFTQTTAPGKLVLSQVVAHGNMAHLRGQSCRVQFLARQSIGTNAVLRLLVLQLTSAGTVDTVTNAGFITAYGANAVDPTFPANHTAITPTLVESGTAVISGAGITTNQLNSTWTQYSGCFTVPSTAKNIIVCIVTHNQLATNDVINIGEIGMYLGEEVRTWTPSSDMVELLQMQKYYSKSFNLGVTPAASLSVAAAGPGATGNIFVAAAVAKAANINIRFPVRMRTITPTVTLYTPVAAGAVPYRITGTTPAVQTTAVTTGIHDYGLQVQATGDAAGTVGDVVGVHWTADAEL
jgi:hypothetical protein